MAIPFGAGVWPPSKPRNKCSWQRGAGKLCSSWRQDRGKYFSMMRSREAYWSQDIPCPCTGKLNIQTVPNMQNIPHILQVIVALGILNVWVLRYGKATPYRGGNAKTLREEFASYGLPFPVMCLVGGIKVGLAVALLVGIWVPVLVQPAAIGLAVLMLGALAMHMKVKDPLVKSAPALSVLAMCAGILLL